MEVRVLALLLLATASVNAIKDASGKFSMQTNCSSDLYIGHAEAYAMYKNSLPLQFRKYIDKNYLQ